MIFKNRRPTVCGLPIGLPRVLLRLSPATRLERSEGMAFQDTPRGVSLRFWFAMALFASFQPYYSHFAPNTQRFLAEIENES